MASYAFKESHPSHSLRDDERALASAPSARCADVVVSSLLGAGIDRLFGLPGGPISPVFHAAALHGMRVVGCRHEGMAGFAAAGYGRARGQHGVVAVTSGPGVLNAVNAIAAAHADDSDLLVLVGEVATSSAGRGALQDGGASGLDIRAVLGSVCAHVETVAHPARCAPAIHQALCRKGVTVLLLPVDVLLGPGPSSGPPLRPSAAAPLAAAAVAPAAQMMKRAARPVLFAGRGVREPGVSEALTVLAELLRAPVVTDIEGKAAIDETHPLSLGLVEGSAAARAAVASSDLVITVGARLDDTGTLGFSCPGLDQPILQIERDDTRLGRAYTPRLALTGDLTASLKAICAALGDIEIEIDSLLARDAWVADVQQMRPEVGGEALGFGPHDPRDVVTALGRQFEGASFVCDIGNHMLFASRGLRLAHPDRFFVSLGIASMGSGIGHAIGLAMARDEQVVCVCGDGGFLMSGNELSTCVEWQVPVIFAVFHDSSLGMVAHGEQRAYGDTAGWKLPELDLCAFGRSLGARAARVDSYADLVAALEGWNRAGPLLLDIPIDPAVEAENARDAVTFDRLASAE